MILHGEMVIELTDENTGTVETIRESNMVTNAVNHLLGLNPMGVFYKASGQYDDMLIWNDALLPICPNMIGGPPGSDRWHGRSRDVATAHSQYPQC